MTGGTVIRPTPTTASAAALKKPGRRPHPPQRADGPSSKEASGRSSRGRFVHNAIPELREDRHCSHQLCLRVLFTLMDGPAGDYDYDFDGLFGTKRRGHVTQDANYMYTGSFDGTISLTQTGQNGIIDISDLNIAPPPNWQEDTSGMTTAQRPPTGDCEPQTEVVRHQRLTNAIANEWQQTLNWRA